MNPFELPPGVPLVAEIEFYAGGRADERPVRLRLKGILLEVEEVMARWRRPDGVGFRVRSAGLDLILQEDVALGLWTAEIVAPAGHRRGPEGTVDRRVAPALPAECPDWRSGKVQSLLPGVWRRPAR